MMPTRGDFVTSTPLQSPTRLTLTHSLLTNTQMTQVRTVTFTNVQDKVERTVEFPDINKAMLFVQSLHVAGVDAIVNLLPEDVAV